jgi:hypothetical protein
MEGRIVAHRARSTFGWADRFGRVRVAFQGGFAIFLGKEAFMHITPRRIAAAVILVAGVAGAAQVAAGPEWSQPSASAIADSQAVAATHRSRTLAALFEEFRTTTPDNARVNSRAISNLFFDGNPMMRLVTSGYFTPIHASAKPLTKFEVDAIASFKAGGPGYFARLDRVGPLWVWCEAVALDNGALLNGTDMDPDVCQTCHQSFPADNTALVGSLNHCDVVRRE